MKNFSTIFVTSSSSDKFDPIVCVISYMKWIQYYCHMHVLKIAITGMSALLYCFVFPVFLGSMELLSMQLIFNYRDNCI